MWQMNMQLYSKQVLKLLENWINKDNLVLVHKANPVCLEAFVSRTVDYLVYINRSGDSAESKAVFLQCQQPKTALSHMKKIHQYLK